ncbi:ubiquitin-related modifier [Acrasis kona]|uniref:Ubiquitin-related modifier n=1 Tax=Acrasis kona TaxID=1008807 RepID=A0AAW2YZ71_9EUKA
MSKAIFNTESFPYPTCEHPEGYEDCDYGESFKASVHLDYQEPEFVIDTNFVKKPFKQHLSDIENKKYNTNAPLALTSPFKLLSLEGANTLRRITELATSHQYVRKSYNRGALVLRGLTHVSDFVRDLTEDERVNSLVSTMAGELLTSHGMIMNRGHVNVGEIGTGRPVDQWHVDSGDYALVIMLSDTDGMVGGDFQIALRDPDTAKRLLKENNGQLKEGDEVLTIKYPGKGWALFMQGCLMLHHVTEVKSSPIETKRVSFVNTYMRRNIFAEDYTRYSIFRHGDPIATSFLDFSRQKAWRIKGMMDYILKSPTYKGEHDRDAIIEMLTKAQDELGRTISLLSDSVDDQVGYLDEKNVLDELDVLKENKE